LQLSSGFELGDDPSMLPSAQPLAQLACLSATASIAAFGKSLELGVSEPEYNMVTEAMANADR
jgi:hypothetical protein